MNTNNKAGKCNNKQKKLVMKIGFLKPKYCLADRLICIKIPRTEQVLGILKLLKPFMRFILCEFRCS